MSAMPAVGGYSTTRQGGSATVGIVTQVSGGAFGLVRDERGRLEEGVAPIATGSGVVTGDRIWIEPRGRVDILGARGGQVRLAGPAIVELLADSAGIKVRLFRGSLLLRARQGDRLRFESLYAEGTVQGEGAVWASFETTQVLGVEGDVKAWHPKLSAAVVLVRPGFFTESSSKYPHLQPKRPLLPDSTRATAFLSRFGIEVRTPVSVAAADHRTEEVDEERAPASERKRRAPTAPARDRASRSEDNGVDFHERMQSHITGQDFEDTEEVPLTAASPKVRGLASGDQPASAPSFEIVTPSKKAGKAKDTEQKELLEKLMKPRRSPRGL